MSTGFVLGDRDSMCQVRLSSRATAPEEYAAEDLRRHLRRMTGQPPVMRSVASRGTVFINDWEAAAAAGVTPEGLQLDGDAFHLRTHDGNLHLLAASGRGVLYGVSDLLHRLGCRWYTPSISRLPDLREAVLPALDVTAKPAFEYRDMIAQDCAEPEFLMRRRVNGHFSRIPDYLGGHMAYGLHVHTYHALVPPSVHFASHPEYYSLVGGKRVIVGGQLCLTNPAVKRIAAESILGRIAANPKFKIFSVSQNDWGGACECATCRKVVAEEGAESGPVLRFANAVAEVVAAKHPDILISTLAYTYTLDAPRLATPHPNVRVRLCPISCCQGHPFGTCEHPRSVHFLSAFGKWSARISQMYIWHYSTNFRHALLPMPNFDELNGNLKFYQDNGVYGVFIQDMGEGGFGAESADLRGFLQSELLWNPQQDVWPLVREWVAAVHGKAAPAVMRYYTLFHDFVREHRDVHPVCYADPDDALFDKRLLKKADAALAQGERLASGFSRKRIQQLRGGLQLPHLWACGGIGKVKGNTFKGQATAADVRALDRLVKSCKAYGMTHANEGQHLAEMAHAWRACLAPVPLKRLRGAGMELVAAPALGGRLLEWHAHGRQWLAAADPDNKYQRYPFSGGYSNLAALSAHTYRGWNEPYRIEAQTGRTALELGTETVHWSGTLHMGHTYRLEDGVLRIDSVLENRSERPCELRWGGSLHLAVGDWTSVAVEAGGNRFDVGADTLEDGFGKARVVEFPAADGVWHLDVPGYAITNAFAGGIEQVIIGVNRVKGILAMDLRTARVPLPPGGRLCTSQRLGIKVGIANAD